jgi:Asp-tRNA(Asn)/Glu-tRNA(Gln) amidotransferase C subunit
MAESFDKFWISIDADVSVLQTELIKAQNQLRQFQATLKKSTDVGAITALNTNITFLENKIAHLNSRIGETTKPMGDATQSLVNFSRIAQDAPYGIIGIANNLNPMLESFQRLAKTEGGTKKALTAMIDGLAGPAGLGVVLGIVSSLAVVFSKQIGEAFSGSSEKIKELREELKKLNDDIYKISGAAQSSQLLGGALGGIISNKGVDINTRKNALKEFKKLYSDNKQIQDLDVKNIDSYTAKYLNSINNLAAVQKDAIGKEKNYIDALTAANTAYKKLIDERQKERNAQLATTKQLEQGITTEYLRGQVDARYVKPLLDAQKAIERAKSSLFTTLSDVLKFDTPDTVKKGADKTIDALVEFSANLKYELAKQLMDIETYKKRFQKLDLSYIEFEYKDAPVKESEFTKKFRKDNADPYKNSIGKVVRENVRNYDLEEKKLKELNNSYENFANLLAGSVTNGLMSVFDAMEQGTNPLEAVGQMFRNIALSIASAVIQATIFQAILTAFPELKAIFAASGALQSAFGYSGPRATGGITNGPSMALIGEAGPEAVIPLSKLSGMLNTTFSAGAMSGGGNAGGGSFVLRGQDLLVAINRTQKSSFLKGQNISLV